jgi:Ser/Thr protein kinase RdoA (MazF antagonist)
MTVDPWYFRPAAERVPALTELATRALRAWGVTDARPELFLEGENAVFRAELGELGLCAVRVHRADYHTADHLQSQVDWCRALTRDGVVKTAAVIDTLAGESFVVEDHPEVPQPRFVTVLRWEPGRSLAEDGASPATFAALGALMARVHLHGETWAGRDVFTGLRWDAEAFLGDRPILGPFWDTSRLDDAGRHVMSRFREVAASVLHDFGYGDDRFGIVHGDFLPQNLLLHEGEITVLDFDDCGHGWYRLDVATALMVASFGADFDASRDALLAGYRKHRHLDESDLVLLPLLIALRLASLVGWVESHRFTPAAKEQGLMITWAGVEAARRYLETEDADAR